MDLDRLAVTLRPRTDWEAVDLGFAMVRTWLRPVYGAWLSIAGPLAFLLILLFGGWGLLAFWWLLPLAEATTLLVLARTVFGDPPERAEVLRQAPRDWPRLIPEILIRRVHPARSFRLPVNALEHSSGATRRKRIAVLESRPTEVPSWLTLAVALFEIGLFLAVLAGLGLLVPSSIDLDWELLGQQFFDGDAAWVAWGRKAVYLLAAGSILLLDPFYTAAGFCIYLNRRTDLEGWDLEIAFRSLAWRLRRLQRADTLAARNAVLVLGALILGQLALPASSAGQAAAKTSAGSASRSPSEVIAEVMTREELQTKVEIEHWQLRDDLDLPVVPERESSRASRFALPSLAGVVEVLLWIGLGVMVVLLIRELRRAAPRSRPSTPAPERRPAERILGLDVRQESLPLDVAGAAEKLWRQGRQVEALSLLYRGALSRLTNAGLELRESFTEADCLAAARRHLTSERANFLGLLTTTWQSAAYAHRLPDADDAARLWSGWRSSFESPATAIRQVTTR